MAEMPKKSWLRSKWELLDIDVSTLKLMFKGACPTFMAIALYQSNSVAHAFGIIGYLAAVVAQISMCIRPRAVFVESAIVNIVGTLLAVSMSLLATWCVVKAREHTAAPGHLSDYNSSACAVSAIWVMFNVWISSTFRAFLPQYRLNVMLYIIFIEVTIIQSVNLSTWSAVVALEVQALKVFFIAHGLAIASNLLIFPNSCRMMVFSDVKKYITGLEAVTQALAEYAAAIEQSELLNGKFDSSKGVNLLISDLKDRIAGHEALGDILSEKETLQQAKAKMLQLEGTLHSDLKLAKRETAWGKLGPSDLESIYRLLHLILLPTSGLASLPAIFEHLIKIRIKEAQLERPGSGNSENPYLFLQQDVWRTIFKELHTPLEDLKGFMSQALKHVSIVLEIESQNRPKTLNNRTSSVEDVEANSTDPEPGDTSFPDHLRQKAKELTAKKGFIIETWKKVKFNTKIPDRRRRMSDLTQRGQEQLLLILYLQHLLHATTIALVGIIDFADEKKRSGSMSKNRLILPGRRRIQKWFRNFFSQEHAGQHQDAQEEFNPTSSLKAVGDSFSKKRDPEHLPPKNRLQVIGDKTRDVGHLLGSPQSAFGARAALAVLSVAIVGYLEPTQKFFFENRCLWATVVIAIGMSPTSGSSVFSFIMRIVGTTIAAVVAIINWYIVDGKTPGVLLFFFLFNFLEVYFIIKYPRFTGIFMVTIITRILVIGYSLEVNKRGVAFAISQNQAYYPVYELGPYRLATVIVGSFASFVWTIFPYPITARSVLRKNLGHGLFLLATYYSSMHATIEVWMGGMSGDPNDKSSPGRRLQKARKHIYSKQSTILASIQEHSSFLGWEPTLGGKFPEVIYNDIVAEIKSMLDSLVLISYAAGESFALDNGEPDSPWREHLASLTNSVGFTSQSITSLLSLLSASVTMGQPLPPYLQPPEPYSLLAKLKKNDPELLSLRNAEESGYSAFAVMEINSALMSDGLGRLVENVTKLVGEVEFKFAEEVKKTMSKTEKGD